MARSPQQPVETANMYKGVHKSAQACAVASHAVLFPVLKELEVEFQKRQILPEIRGAGFNPLWFLAETECNIYLWRNGHSLSDKSQFEFWIDVAKLTSKRLKHLEHVDLANPFLGSQNFWGESAEKSNFDYLDGLLEEETQYLNAMKGLVEVILGHAQVLSLLASYLKVDTKPGCDPLRVVLPL